MSRRTERIGEQIRAELARLVRDELRDPRAGMPTFTRVQVAPDLVQRLGYRLAGRLLVPGHQDRPGRR